MLLYLLNFAAGLAFLGSTLLLAMLTQNVLPQLVPSPVRPFSHREKLSGMAALFSMTFLPPGSLSAVCNIPWSTVLWSMFFALSLLLEPQESPASLKRQKSALLAFYLPVVLIALTLVLLSYYAWRYGLPGTSLNLGVFTVTPFWEFLDLPGQIGFFLLFLSLFWAYPVTRGKYTQGGFPSKRLQHFTYFGLLSGVFFPRPLSFFFHLSEWKAVVADYVFFWSSILLLIWLRGYLSIFPEKKLCPALLLALGALLLLASLHQSAGIFPADAL